MSSTYRRVSQSETDHGVGSRTRSERFADKIYAVVWVTLAILVAKFTDFFRIMLSDERVLKPVFYLAIICIGINTVLLLYLILYLPKFKGIKDSSAWDVYCPRVVPTMTGLGILCAFLLIRATWGVWGFLAPLILGVEFFGFVFLLHFVPWF